MVKFVRVRNIQYAKLINNKLNSNPNITPNPNYDQINPDHDETPSPTLTHNLTLNTAFLSQIFSDIGLEFCIVNANFQLQPLFNYW